LRREGVGRTGKQIVTPFEIGTILEDNPAAICDTAPDYAGLNYPYGCDKRVTCHSADLVVSPKTE